MRIEAAILTGVMLAVTPSSAARELTFEQRLAAQKAIEQVYWSHRIWPKENASPKPPLSSVMSDTAIRFKVDDYLRTSNALDSWWHRPITGDQLQAEMDRMSQRSRDPEMLRELYAALGNDAFVIAETLARQSLGERLIRSWYDSDERFHGAMRSSIERALDQPLTVSDMRTLGGEYQETKITRRHARQGALELDDDEWKQFETLALRQISNLREDAAGWSIIAVLAREPDTMTIASVAWPKRSFDDWWSHERSLNSPSIDGSDQSFSMRAPTDGTCKDDTWDAQSADGPALFGHRAVWTGSEMIVWGGFQDFIGTNVGARFNPATNTWTPTSVGPGVPEERTSFSAVWTGTRMIVWGGTAANGASLDSGGCYDPGTDTWTASAQSANTPSARANQTAVWTGSEMLVWGGNSSAGYPTVGGRYDPSSDSWTPMSTTGVPPGRSGHTAVWTGTQMIVWGGGSSGNFLGTGASYDPTSDSWATLLKRGAPDARAFHTAVWADSEMIVWGGVNVNGELSATGGRYNPSLNTWTATSASPLVGRQIHTAVWTGSAMFIWGGDIGITGRTNTGAGYTPSNNSWGSMTVTNAPSPRYHHSAIWTGHEMIVWGGYGDSVAPLKGGRFSPSTNSWVSLPAGPTPRREHSTVWTGSEMIVWGGYDGATVNTGSRYYPATDTWTPTSVGANVPSARTDAATVWTGTQMVVWGGQGGSSPTNTGGRYNPASNTWTATSVVVGVPGPRRFPSGVWTGTEMLVWGGLNVSSYVNTGGRYNPASNTWSTISTGANVPSVRSYHSAIWTGTRMIVWGGFDDTTEHADGGLYDPAADSWAPTSMVGVPPGRDSHTAVWTGTKMLVWGGFGGESSGGRYDPASDTWASISTTGCPSGRVLHTAVWTGSDMIVWGGSDGSGPSSTLNDGGRYDPRSDTWTPTSLVHAPAGRSYHSGVWTGQKMIVWGGNPLSDFRPALYCAAVCLNPILTFYKDSDGDGFGDSQQSVLACSQPTGFAPYGGDCDENSAGVNPGAIETCNGIDDDCDNVVDDGAEPVELTGVVGSKSGTMASFSWPSMPDASRYDAVRGSLGAWPVGSGTEACLTDDSGTTASDNDTPPLGGGFWYLFRGENFCGNGSYGSQASHGVPTVPRNSAVCP